MQAHETIRTGRGGSHLGDRETGGVRREDRVLGTLPIEGPEKVFLHFDVLDDRLDDHVAIGQVLQGHGSDQATQGRVTIGGFELPLLHRTIQLLSDRFQARLQEAFVDFPNHRFVAGGSAHLGDPAPHQPTADDPNLLYVAHVRLLGFAVSPTDP